MELGTEDAAELMRTSYAHLIAVLGFSNAGKTCMTSSLYLMAAQGILEGFTFAGSLTLQGFEDRARRARVWAKGALPEKLAEHTILKDPRKPALLHMALEDDSAKQRYELLFSDLPGEWSKDLVDRAANAERFSFAHRADGVIVVVEAPLLVAANRHSELFKVKLLLQRLSESVQLACDVPLILMLSKIDLVDVDVPAFDEAVVYAGTLGFSNITPIRACAFSSTPEKVKSGTGLTDALRVLLHGVVSTASRPTRRDEIKATGKRSFQRFRWHLSIL
jgi:hypothetical protein